eukprot:24727-Eustigmatos_ZCMA.PRE.1
MRLALVRSGLNDSAVPEGRVLAPVAHVISHSTTIAHRPQWRTGLQRVGTEEVDWLRHKQDSVGIMNAVSHIASLRHMHSHVYVQLTAPHESRMDEGKALGFLPRTDRKNETVVQCSV